MTTTLKLIIVVAFVVLVYGGWYLLVQYLDERQNDGEGGAGP